MTSASIPRAYSLDGRPVFQVGSQLFTGPIVEAILAAIERPHCAIPLPLDGASEALCRRVRRTRARLADAGEERARAVRITRVPVATTARHSGPPLGYRLAIVFERI